MKSSRARNSSSPANSLQAGSLRSRLPLPARFADLASALAGSHLVERGDNSHERPPVYSGWRRQVTDGNGNRVSGATVTWASPAGGGHVSAATSTTDSTGQASVVATTGTTA